MQGTPNTGYHLDGLPIEYIGVRLEKHYKYDIAFLTTLLLEKVLIEYSQTGKVNYSNDNLLDQFECSRRGLHYAMKRVDETGIVTRDFVQNGLKNHRRGFTIDIKEATRLLSLTDEDVAHLPRGNVWKHFVMQSVIKINKLKREILRMERNLMNAQTEAKIAEIKSKLDALHQKEQQFEQYIERTAARINRRLEKKHTVVDQSKHEIALLEMVVGLGYAPPNPTIN